MKDLLGEILDRPCVCEKEKSTDHRIYMLLQLPQQISMWEQPSAQSRMTA